MAYYDHITMLRLGLGRWSQDRPRRRPVTEMRRAEAILRARKERDQRDAELESPDGRD